MVGQFPLVETAVLEKNPVKKKVYDGMFKGRLPSVIEYIPVETVDSFGPRTLHLTHTDRPTFRNLNASPGAYRAKFADREHTVKIIQDVLKIDIEQTEVKDYIRDPIDMQLVQYGKDSIGLQNDVFFNGNPDTDDTNPSGLLHRFNNDALLIGQAINAAALDVDNNDANRLQFLLLLDEASELAGGGRPNLMAMNRQTWRVFRAALRNLRVLDTTQDQYERMVYSYNGAKFVNPGLKPENALSSAAAGQILLADGTTSVFGTASTSQVIFISTEGDEGVRILKVHGLKTEKLARSTDDATVIGQDMRDTFGIFVPSQFSVSMLDGLDVV